MNNDERAEFYAWWRGIADDPNDEGEAQNYCAVCAGRKQDCGACLWAEWPDVPPSKWTPRADILEAWRGLEDKKRLEWLIAYQAAVLRRMLPGDIRGYGCENRGRLFGTGLTPRDAIDAAMAEEAAFNE